MHSESHRHIATCRFPMEQETALEQGWLLAELEQHFGYGLEELARRFDRSVSWVSRRLALVEPVRNPSPSTCS